MTDEAVNTVPASDAALPSQIIEPRETHETPRAGNHVPEAEAPKEAPKMSTRDAISKAYDESQRAVEEKAKGAVEQAKAKVEEAEAKAPVKTDKPRVDDAKLAKPEAIAEVKAEKGEPETATAERSAPEDRQSEGRKFAEPPARFLPESRQKWANVPNEVKGEFHRVTQEYEAEIEKHKASTERYEPIRQYDEIARHNGRELKDSLAKVVEIETALARNPIAGLEAVLREVGPRKADGSHLSLMEIAQHIVQNPQAYLSASQPAMQRPHQTQSPQKNPEVEELRAEIHAMKAEQTVVPVITKFAQVHEDYHALEAQIAKVLGSGVIEQIYGTGLSAEQKLAEAYRMAGGRGPSSRSEMPADAPEHSEAVTTRPVDPDGSKQIRGAPTAGQSGEPPRKFKTNREALEAAWAAAR